MRKPLDWRLHGRSCRARVALSPEVITALKARYGWRWKLAINGILREYVERQRR